MEHTVVVETSERASSRLQSRNSFSIEPNVDVPCVSNTSATIYNKRTAERLWSEFKIFLSMSLPCILTFTIELLPDLFSVAFVGKTSPKNEFDGFALGITFNNVFGLSLGLGFSSALDTLCSQAHGAGNTLMLGNYLQRALLLLTLLLIPVSALVLNCNTVLALLGQPAEVIPSATTSALVMLPGTFCHWIYEAVVKVMQAQGKVMPMLIVGIVSNGFAVILAYLLVVHFRIGYIGGPLSLTIAAFVMIFLMLLYLLISKFYVNFWSGWSLKEACTGWKEFLSLGIPGILAASLEWWAFEILALLCGLTDDPTTNIGVNAIMAQISTLVFMIYYGLNVSTNCRVGVYLGACDLQGVFLSILLAFMLAVSGSSICALFLYTERNFWVELFTNDAELRQKCIDMAYLIALFQIPNGINAICRGVFRGAGMVTQSALLSFVAYYVFGLPTAILLSFLFNERLGLDQLSGLWLGLVFGLWLCSIFAALSIGLINWKQLMASVVSKQAQLRQGSYSLINNNE